MCESSLFLVLRQSSCCCALLFFFLGLSVTATSHPSIYSHYCKEIGNCSYRDMFIFSFVSGLSFTVTQQKKCLSANKTFI